MIDDHSVHISCPLTINVVNINGEMAGWPPKLPIPSCVPRAFPPNFTISVETLQEAARGCNIEACCRGEPDAVAKLLVEIMKIVHKNPTERNIYLDPNRCDHVLVYVPQCWEVLPLRTAICATFGHLSRELAENATIATGKTRELMQVTQQTITDKESAIIKCAKSAMVTHLKNLTSNLGSSIEDSRTGNLEGTLYIQRIRPFGSETHIHMECKTTVCDFEESLHVYSASTVTNENTPTLARQLILAYAKKVLSGRLENLTVIIANDVAYVHLYDDCWGAMTISEAAAKQTRAFATLAVSYIEAQTSKLLAPVAAYIRSHLDILAADKETNCALLTQYAAEAERYYTQVTGKTLEAPRRILCSRHSVVSALPALTDKDIDSLLE